MFLGMVVSEAGSVAARRRRMNWGALEAFARRDLERATDLAAQHRGDERLRQDRQRSLVERLPADRLGRVAGEEDTGQVGGLAADEGEHLEPGVAGHVHVEEGQV